MIPNAESLFAEAIAGRGCNSLMVSMFKLRKDVDDFNFRIDAGGTIIVSLTYTVPAAAVAASLPFSLKNVANERNCL